MFYGKEPVLPEHQIKSRKPEAPEEVVTVAMVATLQDRMPGVALAAEVMVATVVKCGAAVAAEAAAMEPMEDEAILTALIAHHTAMPVVVAVMVLAGVAETPEQEDPEVVADMDRVVMVLMMDSAPQTEATEQEAAEVTVAIAARPAAPVSALSNTSSTKHNKETTP